MRKVQRDGNCSSRGKTAAGNDPRTPPIFWADGENRPAGRVPWDGVRKRGPVCAAGGVSTRGPRKESSEGAGVRDSTGSCHEAICVGGRALALHFQDWVWDLTTSELEQLDGELAAWRHREREGLYRLLAEQADETLALAIQKGFFRRSAFAELFPRRCERRLIGWFRRWGTEANSALDLRRRSSSSSTGTAWRSTNRADPSMGGVRGSLPAAVFPRELQFPSLKNLRKAALGNDRRTPPFNAYLCKTAHNLWVTRECRGPRPVLKNNFEIDPAPGGVHQDPVGDAVELREAEARLSEALAKLTEEDRAVLQLHFDGLSANQIADSLQITVKQVYRRLHRARRRLAELLGIELPPDNRGRKPKKDQTKPEDDTSHS